MNFKSISDLNRDVLANLHLIPRDVDVVVGIARSGMLPATLIALALNLPLAEMHSFSDGRLLGTGFTRKVKKNSINFSDVRHALIVDDSISSGSSMEAAKELLANLPKTIKLTYCAIYGADRKSAAVDFIFACVPLPRVFEWNVLHHIILKDACVDIDGVLCLDPTNLENDDGDRYLNFLREAQPGLYHHRKSVHLLLVDLRNIDLRPSLG